MDRGNLYGAPSETLQILLDDPAEHDFACARRVLEGLSGDLAVLRPHGLPCSVAEIVAHLLSNAYFNLGVIDSPDPASYRSPLPDWPEVSASDWDRLREEYLAVLERLHTVSEETTLERVVFPANADEAGWTVGYKLTCSVAKHAAYHMGQIVLLRRLLGAWKES